MLRSILQMDRRHVALCLFECDADGRKRRANVLRERRVGGIQTSLHFRRRAARSRLFIEGIVGGPRPRREQNGPRLKRVGLVFEQARVVGKILRRGERLGALTLENEKVRMPLTQLREWLPTFPVIGKGSATGSDRANIDLRVQRRLGRELFELRRQIVHISETVPDEQDRDADRGRDFPERQEG